MEFEDSRPLTRRPTAPEPAMLTGTFRDTATGPTSALRVICDYHGERETFGPVVWRREWNGTGWDYPHAGDTAYLVQSRDADRSVWVCVLWKAA